MGVDTPQVRAHQAGGDGRGILLRHSMRGEEAADESIGRLGPDMDAVGGCC